MFEKWKLYHAISNKIKVTTDYQKQDKLMIFIYKIVYFKIVRVKKKEGYLDFIKDKT